MNKIHILTYIAILMCLNINAQLILSIKNIKVSNINVPILKDHFREGDNDGPFVKLYFVIKNNADSVIKLHPSKSEIIIQFQYKNLNYSKKLSNVTFMGNDTLLILPHQQYESFVDDNLLLGSFILKSNNNDYRIELIEILPTIKLFYKEEKIRINSSEILNVEVIDPKILDNVKRKR